MLVPKPGDKAIIFHGIECLEVTVVRFHKRHAGLDFWLVEIDGRPEVGLISRATIDIWLNAGNNTEGSDGQ